MSNDYEREMKDLGFLDDPTDEREYSKADYESIFFPLKLTKEENMIKEFVVSRSWIAKMLQQVKQRNQEANEILEHLIDIIGEKE